MATKKFVLSRDLQPPHMLLSQKVCKTCQVKLPNDFEHFPRVAWGDRKLGKETTGSTCKTCKNLIISRGMLRKSGADAEAERLMQEDILSGQYLKPKGPSDPGPSDTGP